MAGVGRRPVADQLGVYAGAPGQRMVELLQDQDGCALPGDEAVTVDVERARRRFRGVVATGECTDGAVHSHADRGDGRLRATGQGDDGVASANLLCCLADAVGARRAGAHHREVGAPGAHVSRHHAGRHVHQHLGRGVHGDAAVAAPGVGQYRLLGHAEAADARPDDDGRLVRHRAEVESAVGHRITGRGHGQGHRSAGTPGVLAAEQLDRIEALYLARNLGGQVGGIEGGDPGHAAAPVTQAVPGRRPVVAERRHAAHAGHDHPYVGHWSTLPPGECTSECLLDRPPGPVTSGPEGGVRRSGPRRSRPR